MLIKLKHPLDVWYDMIFYRFLLFKFNQEVLKVKSLKTCKTRTFKSVRLIRENNCKSLIFL